MNSSCDVKLEALFLKSYFVFTDVNECQQHVCLNGATCVNTFGGFRCKCKSGYRGKFCDKGWFIKAVASFLLDFFRVDGTARFCIQQFKNGPFEVIKKAKHKPHTPNASNIHRRTY